MSKYIDPNNPTDMIWVAMTLLSVPIVPACLFAGPPGWICLVFWCAWWGAALPDAVSDRFRTRDSRKAKEWKDFEDRSRADAIQRAKNNRIRFPR